MLTIASSTTANYMPVNKSSLKISFLKSGTSPYSTEEYELRGKRFSINYFNHVAYYKRIPTEQFDVLMIRLHANTP